jgi:hypothetical protein
MRRLVGPLGFRVTLSVDDSPLKINTLCSMTRSKLWPVSRPRQQRLNCSPWPLEERKRGEKRNGYEKREDQSPA